MRQDLEADESDGDADGSGDEESLSSNGTREGRASLDVVPRRCTDLGWTLVFLLCNGCLVYVASWGAQHGKFNRFLKVRQFDGHACGHGHGDTRHQPYLFFCSSNASAEKPELNLSSRICVETCPNSSETSRACPFSETPTQDYPTEVFQDLCRPKRKELEDVFDEWVVNNYLSFYVDAATVAQSYFLTSIGASILISILYLRILHDLAGYVVWGTLTVLAVVPCATMTVCGICWYHDGCGDLLKAPDALRIGALAGVVGLSSASILCYQYNAMNSVIDVITEAVGCMFEEVSLLLEPLVHLASRSVVFGCGGWVMLKLLTSGEHAPVGPRLVFKYSVWEKLYMGFTMFMFLWFLEFIEAVSSFAVMYVTELWYFQVATGSRLTDSTIYRLLYAYWLVLRYHSGTLVVGSLLMLFTAPLRMVLRPLRATASLAFSPLGCCLRSVCCCLVDFYEDYLRQASPEAWMEVVMRAKPFADACRSSCKVVRAQDSMVDFLSGVTNAFALAGVVITGYLCSFVAAALIESNDSLTDENSPDFLLKPQIVIVMAGWLAFAVALPFHYTYDTVSCAILYCLTIHTKNQMQMEREERAQRSCMQLISCAPLMRPGRW